MLLKSQVGHALIGHRGASHQLYVLLMRHRSVSHRFNMLLKSQVGHALIGHRGASHQLYVLLMRHRSVSHWLLVLLMGHRK
ncbi:unnamed protein product [Larinioides sclopetarius]